MDGYIVVDLEMCKVLRGLRCKEYSQHRETIQIGAVLMDEDYNITDKFSTFVRPQYGWLSSDIEQLTGIKAEDIADAPDFESALSAFAAWLPDGDIKMVQWSEADALHIRKEMDAKGIENDRISKLIEEESVIDCQKLFSERMEEKKCYNLTNALIAADIMPEGREHDGLSDAYNTALLFAKLEQNEKLVLNPIYESARKEEVVHLNYSMANLLAGLNINVSTLPA